MWPRLRVHQKELENESLHDFLTEFLKDFFLQESLKQFREKCSWKDNWNNNLQKFPKKKCLGYRRSLWWYFWWNSRRNPWIGCLKELSEKKNQSNTTGMCWKHSLMNPWWNIWRYPTREILGIPWNLETILEKSYNKATEGCSQKLL